MSATQRGAEWMRVGFRPGQRAARRRVLASEYVPRYQLATGDDPWSVASESPAAAWEALSEEELAGLGLSGLTVVSQL
jgi:hypothetical protein